jgi:hypothetical protein
MRYRSSFVALAFVFLVSACTHASTSTTTSDASAQPDVAVAQNGTAESPAPSASASPDAADAVASPGADEAAAPPSAAESAASPVASDATDSDGASPDAKCDILPNAQVEELTHLTVKAVKIGSNPDQCNFTFVQNAYAGVSLEYASSGGKDELDNTRTAEGGVQGLVGGLFKAAGGDKSPDSDAMKNVAIASPPPDLPKIGDDQFGYSVGFVTSFIATKGDAYVQSSIAGFTPDGTSRWQVVTELARRVLAAH